MLPCPVQNIIWAKTHLRTSPRAELSQAQLLQLCTEHLPQVSCLLTSASLSFLCASILTEKCQKRPKMLSLLSTLWGVLQSAPAPVHSHTTHDHNNSLPRCQYLDGHVRAGFGSHGTGLCCRAGSGGHRAEPHSCCVTRDLLWTPVEVFSYLEMAP